METKITIEVYNVDGELKYALKVEDYTLKVGPRGEEEVVSDIVMESNELGPVLKYIEENYNQ